VINSPSEYGGLVLIVDDLPRNLQLLGRILTESNYEVIAASSGEKALARAESRRPDLVLLDLMMPEMDGMEVCRRLRHMPTTADVPVIFLTAANEAELAAKALSAGAVDYIFKPFNTAELLARVRTHVALARTRDELRRIIAQKNDLMSAVAHDLKNPISAVRFSALMLREQGVASPDPRAELVDSIVDACEGALAFIHDRLEKSARSARLERIHIARTDLIVVLHSVVQQNLATAAAKGIELDMDFRDDVPVSVLADHNALCRVLNNVLSNAVKFSPRDTSVSIGVTRQSADGPVRIAVRDRGPGLTDEDKKLLFKPYQRLSARPTAGESSTGLGLSLSRDLVEAMKGRIGCDSEPGRGATFWIEVPVCATETDSHAAPAQAQA
jgi:two-component system sensor histidine kinase/response regulator